ncbi:MAG: response regulator [Candidatus Hodarchaeota archaeon]
MMKPTVLVVDDDESIRVSLKLLLEEKYNVITVLNGEEALNKLNQMHIDAVLLDVKMNGIDGLEILEKIRTQHKNIVVIMLTVIEDIKTAIRAIKLGAKDYLLKPYEKKELLLSLKKNLEL